MRRAFALLPFLLLSPGLVFAREGQPLASAWADTSVNAVVFRKNSVVTFKDFQYTAFYDPEGWLVLASRKQDGDTWTKVRSRYRGNVRDAHNSISIMIDGGGYVHAAWDHHDSSLRYARGLQPGSLELGDERDMTGNNESRVSYPEFFRLDSGNLLFFYREGESGAGNLVINRYRTGAKTWERLHDVLIDGERTRNAYWQACVDARGAIHLSWVWRETRDVATNHDLSYAKSTDEGETWVDSRGTLYRLPITARTADYARRIPQRSNLMNQTSICADQDGRPYIASSWTPAGTTIPQYQVVYHDGKQWKLTQVTRRTTPFSLSGGGTRKLPMSRPQIVATAKDGKTLVAMVFRDVERGSRVSIAVCRDITGASPWKIWDVSQAPVGDWEPSYDTELWKSRGVLDLYVQNVGQGDGETLERLGPQPVSILRWTP